MYLHLPHQTTPKRPKVVRDRQFLALLTSKCASGHSGVHFFDISTSKSASKLVCFVHVDFGMCFAPQRRALLRHLNFQKRSENGVVCTFWLPNVLRATTACTFATSQLPKVAWGWHVLYIMTCNFSSLIWPDGSAPAALASLLFDPPESQMLRNTFLPFCALASSVFWFFLFSCLLSSSLFFSDSSHLCFVICPYCWKFDF